MSLAHLMRFYKVHLTLTNGMLGTVPKNKDVYSKFIATKMTEGDYPEADIKSKTAQEVDTVPVSTDAAQAELESRGWTGFHEDAKGVLIYEYMIRGFFKEAMSSLRAHPDAKSHGITAFKKVVSGGLFVTPRSIYPTFDGEQIHRLGADGVLLSDDETIIECLERPLRVQTPQGERVALARSDMLPPGTEFEFTLQVLHPKMTTAVIEEVLSYGAYKALGQWRSAQYGTFDYTMEEVAKLPAEDGPAKKAKKAKKAA